MSAVGVAQVNATCSKRMVDRAVLTTREQGVDSPTLVSEHVSDTDTFGIRHVLSRNDNAFNSRDLVSFERTEIRSTRIAAVDEWLRDVDEEEEYFAQPSGKWLTELEKEKGRFRRRLVRQLRGDYRQINHRHVFEEGTYESLPRDSLLDHVNGAVDECGTPCFMVEESQAHIESLQLVSIRAYLEEKDTPRPGPDWPGECEKTEHWLIGMDYAIGSQMSEMVHFHNMITDGEAPFHPYAESSQSDH